MDSLLDEVIVYMLHFLPWRELRKVSMCSTRMRRLCSNELLWKGLCAREFGESVQLEDSWKSTFQTLCQPSWDILQKSSRIEINPQNPKQAWIGSEWGSIQLSETNFKSQVHFVEVKLQTNIEGTFNFGLGMGSKTMDFDRDISVQGIGAFCGSIFRFGEAAACPSFQIGDAVGMIVDYAKRTIEWFHNGLPIGRISAAPSPDFTITASIFNLRIVIVRFCAIRSEADRKKLGLPPSEDVNTLHLSKESDADQFM